MPHLLHLDSSADLNNSRSRQITATFAGAWHSRGPEYTVTYRDLHAFPLPHVADAALHWPQRLRPAGGGGTAGADQASSQMASDGSSGASAEAAFQAAEALQDQLISELLTADVLLVGAPLYNYTVPSTLKAWIDHIHVPGRTAPFDGQTQPLAGRPAVIISSRGAAYDAGGPREGWDHAIPVLQIILGTALGMSVEVITTSLTLAETVPSLADQLQRSRAELAAAHEAAAEAARRLP